MPGKKKNKWFPVGELRAALAKKEVQNRKLSTEEEELVKRTRKVKTLQRQLNRLKKLVSIRPVDFTLALIEDLSRWDRQLILIKNVGHRHFFVTELSTQKKSFD